MRLPSAAKLVEPIDPDFIPAQVVVLGEKRARVTHPLGDDHANARLTRERLIARGWIVEEAA